MINILHEETKRKCRVRFYQSIRLLGPRGVKKLEDISVIHLFNMSETVFEAVLLYLDYQTYREKIFEELCDPEGLSILSSKGKKMNSIKKRFFERTFSDHAGI
jgi:hypothetical protein